MATSSAQLSAASPDLLLTSARSTRWTYSRPTPTTQIPKIRHSQRTISANSHQRPAKAAPKASRKPNIFLLLSETFEFESVPVEPLSYSDPFLLSATYAFTPHHVITNALEIRIHEIPLSDGTILRRHQPLVVLASISVPDDCLHADIPDLDISLAATNRTEMLNALQDLIAFLWHEYALEDNANLTPKAQQLKACLLRDYAVAS